MTQTKHGEFLLQGMQTLNSKAGESKRQQRSLAATSNYLPVIIIFKASCVLLMILIFMGCSSEHNPDSGDYKMLLESSAHATSEIFSGVACVENIQDENDCGHEPTDTELSDDMPFFGVWKLEKIALRYDTLRFQGIPYKHVSLPIITNYIGYELEFTHEYVRLGDRKHFAPIYSLRQFGNSLLDSSFSFDDFYIWRLAYYSNFQEMREAFEQRGVNIGRHDEEKGDIIFDEIRINYHDSDEIWWRGAQLDAEAISKNIAYNPLLRGFIVLNGNFILLGYGWHELILARRIGC